jgi:hypothetical protein
MRGPPARLAALALCAVLSGCGFGGRASPPPTPGDYADLLGRLDASSPGRGTCDAEGLPVADSPRACAMVLAAEAHRLGSGGMADVPNLGASACAWLLDHADEDGDGVAGWGLPFAVDFFLDGSTNAAGTEYTITLGLVMNALLDWVDASPAAPRERVLDTLGRAAAPYLAPGACSPSGLFAYSLEPCDLPYDCFNPAAYLAGQFQRLSGLASDPDLARRMRETADRTADALIAHHMTDPRGGWCWPYSLQRPRAPNDLCHAAYIILGIENYIRFGGARAPAFDFPAVLRHLDSFRRPGGGAWVEKPRGLGFWRPKPPRLYGIGMALRLVPPAEAASLAATAQGYRTPDGRYPTSPRGAATVDGEVFLLYGLSYFLFHETDERAPE